MGDVPGGSGFDGGVDERESACAEGLDEQPMIILGAPGVGVGELGQLGREVPDPAGEKSMRPSSASSSDTQWIFAVARPNCSTRGPI